MTPVYRKPEDLPQQIPVFPLDGALLFPRGQLPLNIFEPRYLNMIDDAMRGDRLIGMIQPMHERTGEPTNTLSRVGCVGRITSYTETNDARYLISLNGICRFEVVGETTDQTPYRTVHAHYGPFISDFSTENDTLITGRADLLQTLKGYLAANAFKTDWSAVDTAPLETLINALATGCPFSHSEKQALLEAPSLQDRLESLTALLKMNTTNNGGSVQ